MHGNDMLDDPRLIAKIIDENNRRLSRTRSGVSDTSASHAKLPLLLSGEALRKQSAENEGRVCRFIADCRGEPAVADPAAVRQGLFVLADLTNAGLLPAGRLRIWDVPYRARPWRTTAACQALAGQFRRVNCRRPWRFSARPFFPVSRN